MIPYNEENRAKMTAVAERLLGSATGADDAIQREFGDEDLNMTDLHEDLLKELDDQVAECEQCGYWSESGAVDENGVCDDCKDGEREDA